MTEQDRHQDRLTRIGSAQSGLSAPSLSWVGDKTSELSTLALPRLKSGFDRSWRTLLSGSFLASLFLVGSAIYCFGIGRDRYTSVSEFVIKQPMPPSASGSILLGGSAMSSSVLSSLEDGRYLQTYLKSSDVKQNVFPDPVVFKAKYAPVAPDDWPGLPADAVEQDQLAFFQRQLEVIPQEMSGAIVLTTNAYTPQDAFDLNQSLLNQAQSFVNEVNQSISADQRLFAEKQVAFAKDRLKKASDQLEAFQDKYGQLNPEEEQQATTSFINNLESRLVDLKVEEASLRRQYRDPDAPEVAFVADQVRELERQIQEERDKAVGPGGRDLNKLANQASRLQSDVEFARDSLSSAMTAADNSRMESQRQLKFIVMLSKPQVAAAPDDSWRWKAFLSCIGSVIVIWGVGGFMLSAVNRD